MKDAKKFWNTQHASQQKYWLTGTHLDKLLKTHDLARPSGQVVMEIGVGLGHCVRQFSEDNAVYAIDISQVALDNLSDVTEFRYLTPDMESIPNNAVDVAICHLVLQHCDTETVKFLIKQTLRILKFNGIASFQTAFSVRQTGYVKKQSEDGKLFWRTHEEIKDIIGECGGTVLSVDKQGPHPCVPNGTHIEWCIIKFKR